MICITGPALAIILVVGYFGINTIAGAVGNLFKGKEERDENRK